VELPRPHCQPRTQNLAGAEKNSDRFLKDFRLFSTIFIYFCDFFNFHLAISTNFHTYSNKQRGKHNKPDLNDEL
jgi:hypothetical protein